MYFSPITVAALTPFILGLSQASAIQDAPPGVSLVPDLGLAAMSVISGTEYPPLGGGYPGDNYPGDWYDYKCDYWRDWDCYKKYWQQYKYCHPYDQSCYKDCKDYDDYYDHCKNYDKGYGKCYDRCYYDKDGCDKWQECRKDDYDCYKKKRKEDYCPPKEDRCKGKHEYPDDYCKPWDWKCHDKNKKDQEKDYECHPKKDKDCYPDYPDYPKYPDYDDHDKCKDDDCDDEHHDPQNYVSVTYHGPKGEWSHDVWPDGDENWLDEVSPDSKTFDVDWIEYKVKRNERNVRCLAMKSWFPWTPLPIEKYKESHEHEHEGYYTHHLHLKTSEPIEVIRCDFP